MGDDVAELTPEARKAINGYLRSLARKWLALFGIVNIGVLGTLASYIFLQLPTDVSKVVAEGAKEKLEAAMQPLTTQVARIDGRIQDLRDKTAVLDYQSQDLTSRANRVRAAVENIEAGATTEAAEFIKTLNASPDTQKLLSRIENLETRYQGAIAWFREKNCPDGWSAVDELRGRYVVGVPSGGEVGLSIGSALSSGEDRPTGAHTHQTITAVFFGSSAGGPQVRSSGSNDIGRALVSTGDPIVGGAETIKPGTNAPYVQLLPCRFGAP